MQSISSLPANTVYINSMKTLQKLEILADAAKYDASCASSGGSKRDSRSGKGMGSTTGMGICHAYAPDGRCISLLKILLTNFCIFDCAYCVNRNSSNVRRARFTADEVVWLTIEFYRRNYNEGLFLSSGIIQSPNYTMEQLVEVARKLREVHDFRGYIHLKTIPDADPELLSSAGLHADRLSINIEMPTEQGLTELAPEKDLRDIRVAMGQLRSRIEDNKAERKAARKARAKSRPKAFAAAGQSTQMIVGADKTPDTGILSTSQNLYSSYRLSRVYYSAFSPIPDASSKLPPKAPPMLREHRLYQADWLLRHYGFALDDIERGTQDGMLDLEVDPKLAWALVRRDLFPMDVNRASRSELLRIPGLGPRNVQRILSSRKHSRLRLEHLARLRVSLDKVRPFIITTDWHPSRLLDREDLRYRIAPKQGQLFPDANHPAAA